ncbi:MAG TPA: tetratricopeptide repeat protein [Nitrospira sp.]
MRHATRLLLFWLLIPICLFSTYTFAEIHTVTATGEYRMAEHDTPADAQRLASVAAKSLILKQTIDYLDTVAAVKQLGLNQDELRAYTVGLLEIKQYPGQTTTTEAIATVSVPVKTLFDPAVVTRQLDSLMHNERAKTELTRIRDKIDAYQKELEHDRQRLATSKDDGDRKVILQHRRDVLGLIDTEEQFARTWTSLLGAREAKVTEGQSTQQDTRVQKKALPRTPDNAEEHRKKGGQLTQEGRYDEALAEFRLALRLMPELDRAHLGLGAALQGKGDLDGAIVEYRALLKRHPNDPDVHNNLGSALQLQGNVADAIREYRTAIDIQPNDALTHFNLGTALSTNGQVKEAIEEYRTAIRLNPDLVQAYFDLGSLLKDNDQTRDAVDAFRDYVRRAPDTAANRPWLEQARAYLDKIREQRHDRDGRQGPGS